MSWPDWRDLKHFLSGVPPFITEVNMTNPCGIGDGFCMI